MEFITGLRRIKPLSKKKHAGRRNQERYLLPINHSSNDIKESDQVVSESSAEINDTYMGSPLKNHRNSSSSRNIITRIKIAQKIPNVIPSPITKPIKVFISE